MGFRFRESISICPGVSLNLGKSGVSSLSVGPRCASVSIGKRGTHANLGMENIENEMEDIINIHMDIPNIHNAISLDSLRL
jgi:hypothetical protein